MDYVETFYHFLILADLSGDHEAPRFLVELVSVTVVEGSAARFEACVRGRPAPTVRWLKDGKPLLTDGLRLTVSQSANDKSTLNTTSHSLLIRDTLPRDSGTYTCIATSASGTAITEAGLNVRGEFDLQYASLLYFLVVIMLKLFC